MRVAFSSSCAWAEAHQTYATLLITYSPLHQRFVNTHPSTNNRKERKFDNCVLTLHWRSAQKLLCKVKASMLQARKKTFDDWIYDFISALSLNWRPCLFSNSGWTGGLECLIFHQNACLKPEKRVESSLKNISKGQKVIRSGAEVYVFEKLDHPSVHQRRHSLVPW